nr:DUF3967 domain-containing protein [Bacillus toyonensis]
MKIVLKDLLKDSRRIKRCSILMQVLREIQDSKRLIAVSEQRKALLGRVYLVNTIGFNNGKEQVSFGYR